MTYYKNIVKWWLKSMLIFMLFQHYIVNTTKIWNTDLSTFFRQLDTFTIIIFSFLVVIEYYKNKECLNRSYYILWFLIFISICMGIFSGMINRNPLLMTIHGTFNNIKYFLVILIYAAFFREFKDFKKIFEILLIFTVLMGFIAFIQEIWALSSRYIFKKDTEAICYLDFYYFLNPGYKGDHNPLWRLGVFRVSSFTISPSILGLYSLLIFTIYIHTVKKVNFAVFISLFSGIMGSVSRVVYASFVLVGTIQFFRGKRWLIVVLIPALITLFYLSALPEIIMSKFSPKSSQIAVSKSADAITEHNQYSEVPKACIRCHLRNLSIITEHNQYSEVTKDQRDLYRNYIREVAIKIWKGHVLFGIGPGAYGDAISLKYNPSIYEYKRYGFAPIALLSLKEWKDPDQFWPVLLAQVGIAGTAGFAALFMYLFLTLYRLKNKASSDDIRELCTGLLLFAVIVIIYTFGYSLNIAPFIFTFFAFVGFAMGLNDER